MVFVGGYLFNWTFLVVHVVKNPPASAGNVGLIPGLGRSLEEGMHGNPLQYSCLVNCMDRGASWATVHGVVKYLKMTYRATLNNKQLTTLVKPPFLLGDLLAPPSCQCRSLVSEFLTP